MGLFSPRISAKEMVPLCRQLATTYDAGIPILKSIEMVARNTRKGQAHTVLVAMHESLRTGSTLGEAARAHQKHLPPFFVELLATGEFGGKLDVMLRDLADYYEDRVAMNRKITGAMVYPMFLITACWFLGTFAIRIISSLDLTSGKPFDFAAFLGRYLLFQGQVLVTLAIGFGIAVLLSRFGLPQYLWGAFATHVWPLRNITRKFALARFFRTFSLLVSSGVDIRHCISNAAEVSANAYIRKDLLKAVPLVSQGATLTQAFGVVNTLSPVGREMIHIGEQTGNLDQCLRKVSDYHFAEANHAVSVAVKLLEQGILLLAACFVGYTIISFYSKYLSMYDSFLN